MSGPDPGDRSRRLASTARETGGSLYDHTQQTLLTGIAITIPLIVTLYVLTVALDFISGALDPFIAVLRWVGVIEEFERVQFVSFLIELGVYPYVVDFFTELVALIVLFLVVATVGTVGRNRYGERIIDYVDLLITSIPGVGTVYKSFRRMGDVMLDEGGENFQEIKLVQCFEEDMYVLGFVTSDSPPTIEESTGHEDMVSMFLPLAPNPVTGGLLTYVPESQVYDIDMTVEEGVRSILTSGVATGEDVQEPSQLTMDDLKRVTDLDWRASGRSDDGDETGDDR
ncbi:DUF502 domain-containing protein [Haloplanus aerogenes]|uniref:DUF502 domain-containing protein n=1 Tax=Haloplanus aerogenes TaxID=660522 RepID=A0A3M0DRI2_9EURY|nr:DUF502 domain-containing protein [Haloplanus aerogenes]AZH24341.1 DUF502 domain-containing protein [Haloplanus aerogenes]RMB24025.1 putative membrane protein [Haloplanus aerogenes]